MTTPTSTNSINETEMIFDFMGCVRSQDENMHKWEMSTLRYHNSWDALITVYKKIQASFEPIKKKESEWAQEAYKKAGGIFSWTSEAGEQMWNVHKSFRDFDFDKAYNATIQYIAWYNKQPKP